MSIFFNDKFMELEERYSNGSDIEVDDSRFKITLTKKTNNPDMLIDYDWKIELPDGFEFQVPMGAKNFSFSDTRLGVIIKTLEDARRYENDYLANAINDTIDEIYRSYKD